MPDWRTAHFKEQPKAPRPKPRRWPKVLALIGLPIVAIGALAMADNSGLIDVQATAERWLAKVSPSHEAGPGSAAAKHVGERAPGSHILDEDKGAAGPPISPFEQQPAPASESPAAPPAMDAAKRASLGRGIDLMTRELAPIEADIQWRMDQLVVHRTYLVPPTAAEREAMAIEYANTHPRMSSIEAGRVNQALGNARTDMRNHRQRIKEQAEHRESLIKRIDKAKAEMGAIP